MSSSSTSETRTPIINPVQVMAGTAAAVTAAVVGSTLGVAGTLIGAGIASVVASTASALYSHAISSTTSRLRRPVPGSDDGSTPVPVPPSAPLVTRLRALGWKKLLIPAVLLFTVAIVVLTGGEALAGKPVSAVVTGSQANGTTLSQVGNGHVGTPQEITPVVSPTQEPTPTASTTATPTDSVNSTPTETPTPTGSTNSTAEQTKTPEQTSTPSDSAATATATSSPSPTTSANSSTSATSATPAAPSAAETSGVEQ